MESVHELCVNHLEETHEPMGQYYDHSQKKAPPYSVEDVFMLNGKNIRMRWAAKKLNVKLFGPFKVVRLVGQVEQSVELQFPLHSIVHNIFYTSLIEPYLISVPVLRNECIGVTDSGYID